jgi:hypothetical protein
LTEAVPPAVGQGKRPPVKRPWPRLPRWFWVGTAVALVTFLAVGAVALRAVLTFEEQPLYERRSAPAPGLSHDVGRVGLPDAPLRPVPCGAIRGLQVQGGEEAGGLLADAVRSLCRDIKNVGEYGAELALRIEALAKQGAIVSFANFGRTGELTTTVAGPPPRVLLSDAFLRGGGQFKGFLLPELAHELWHAGAEVTAQEELEARKVELAACADVPASEAFRGCTDAKRIVDEGDEAALRGLRAVGYP